MLDGQSNGAIEELPTRLDGDLRIAEGDPLKIVVFGLFDIEQCEIPTAVENDRSITGRFDDNGFIGGTLAKEIIGPFDRPRRTLPCIDIVKGLVGAGMHQNNVARLHARAVCEGFVAASTMIIVSAVEP